MMRHRLSGRIAGRTTGFTLIDLAIAMGIVGILAAISITLYSRYTTRAQAADIVVKYDAARSTTGANLAGDTVLENCDEVTQRLPSKTIPAAHARIGYGFEAVSEGGNSGFRPVLTICASVADQGAQAVKVARAAHDEFAKSQSIEAGAVLNDTVVSFAVPLTAAGRVVCKTAPKVASPGCGSAPASPAVQQAVAQPPASTPSTVQQAVTQQPAATGPVCQDKFLGNCSVDFDGQCDDDFVKEYCQKTCGQC